MKLIVQIPCFNEEQTIARTIADIPREVPGVDSVEVLVVNDGSTDATVERAVEAGADHITGFAQNRGLAAAFYAGLDESVRLGADIVVNTDGDNQYCGHCIADLVAPIVRGDADMVIGARPIEDIEDFSRLKKRLQRLGSWAVRRVSGTDVSDATSGFRAYSRAAAQRLTIVSDFTYTAETLIQAGRSGMAVAEVPIQTNRKTRESRLFKSIPQYIWRSLSTMVRIYALYMPLQFFTTVAVLLFVPGFFLGARFLYYYFTGSRTGHIQSLILAAILMLLGFQTAIVGFLADLLGASRKLMQEVLYQVRRSRDEAEQPSESRPGVPHDLAVK